MRYIIGTQKRDHNFDNLQILKNQGARLPAGVTIRLRRKVVQVKPCYALVRGCLMEGPGTWVVLKIVGPFRSQIILRHPISSGTKMDPFGNYSHEGQADNPFSPDPTIASRFGPSDLGCAVQAAVLLHEHKEQVESLECLVSASRWNVGLGGSALGLFCEPSPL